MPYDTVKKHPKCPGSKPYGLVKRDDGRLMGCHASVASVNRQRGAILAQEAKAMDDVAAVEVEKEAKQDAGVMYYMPGSATSFAEIDEFIQSVEMADRAKELVRQFQGLTENIMFNSEVTDKPAAMKTLFGEFEARIGDAVEGQKGLLEKTIGAIKHKLGIGTEYEKVEQPRARLMVWKEGDRYRWMAVYSNKYRDQDSPPEILASKAHTDFIAKVDSGLLPFPELRHFHIEGSRWGVSDWLAFDEQTGFSLASGTVDLGHEKEAEAIMALPEPLGVSHGMEIHKRNEKDTSIIEDYSTYEISDLPLEAAANKLTGFSVLEGDKHMTIPKDKKDYLRKVGLNDEDIAKIDADLEGKAKTAAEAGLEFKEEAKPEGERKDETTQPEAPTPPYATKDEVADAIVQAVKPLMEQLAALTGAVTTMAKSDEERILSKAVDTPALSIAALVTRQMSVIGKDQTRLTVDQMALAKDKPDETKPPVAPITGLPFIDKMLSDEQTAK